MFEMKAYRGSIVNPISLNQIDYIDDGLIVVENGGLIINFVTDSKQIEECICELAGKTNCEIKVLSKGEFIIPGFIDTHTHAPQFINLAVGSELKLIDWLQKYTYPGEKLFECLKFAQNNYKLAVDLTVNNGTTTCLWNDTIFTESSILLCDTIDRKGQRGLVGKVCMDNHEFCPNYYVETTSDSLMETKKLITTIREKQSTLVLPVITPRSAISCTQLLMRQLCSLAEDNRLLIQSHLCESVNGCELVRKRFPQHNSCVDVFEEYGLLHSNSVMAHCVHLTDKDCHTLKRHNVGIAHCPSSNANLRSGRMPLRKYLDMGLKVGLGTDVSGGSTPSILRVIQDAYLIHKLADISDNGKHCQFVTYEQLFYLATVGGASVLNMDTIIGNFQTNKLFDALIIKVSDRKLTRLTQHNNTPVFDAINNTLSINFSEYSLKEIFEIFILNGCENDIINVIVNGNIIK